MMKNLSLKKILALVCAATMAVAMMAGCGSTSSGNSSAPAASASSAAASASSTASSSAEEQLSVSTRISMSTGSSGSLYYTGGIAVTQLWTEQIPGISASASSSSGSAENVKLLVDEETNMGIIQSNIIMDAYNGDGAYEGNPQSQLRILAPLTSATYHILARKDAHITCLADSKGKRVCTYPAGSGNAVTLAALYDAIGMSTDDVIGSNVALSESIDALKNGALDMTIVFGQYPNSTVMDALAGSDDLEVVSFSPEEIEKITAANSWIVAETVPAGTYDGQDAELTTLTHNGFICVREDLPEEDAYALVKTLFGNLDSLYASYAALNCFATQHPIEAVESLSVPLHSGAQKAFESLGLL